MRLASRSRKTPGKNFIQQFVALGALGAATVYLARRPAALAVIAGAIAAIGAGFYFAGYSGTAPRAKTQVSAESPRAPASPPVPPAAEASPAHEDGIAAILKDPGPARSIGPQRDPALDSWFVKAYLRCWKPPVSLPAGDYAAQIRVVHKDDGSLGAAPVLVNPPTDPAWRAFSDSAIHAVKHCDLQVPAQYLAHFDQWKKMTLHFSPDSASE